MTEQTEIHMRLTTGHDPATALCDRDITGPLANDVADVTCPDCRFRTNRLIAEQERQRAEDMAGEDDY